MIDEIKAEIKAALAELEYAGIIERTGEMEWDEHHHEWQPVYAHTELGRALSAARICRRVPNTTTRLATEIIVQGRRIGETARSDPN